VVTENVEERLIEIRARLARKKPWIYYADFDGDVPWLLELVDKQRESLKWHEELWEKAMTRVADHDELYVENRELEAELRGVQIAYAELKKEYEDLLGLVCSEVREKC